MFPLLTMISFKGQPDFNPILRVGCSAALPAARRAAPGHAAGRAAPWPPPADADAAAAPDAAADAVADAATGPDACLPGAGENE
jgi:hypothetical protein